MPGSSTAPIPTKANTCPVGGAVSGSAAFRPPARSWSRRTRRSSGSTPLLHPGEEQIAGTEFTLMKLDTPGYPDMNTYLKRSSRRRPGWHRSGVAHHQCPRPLRERMGRLLTLVAMEDILDAIWADRPAVPSTPVIQVADDLAGFSAEQKLAMVRTALGQSGGDWTIIASLDDIAWLTNLRASDVSYNPSSTPMPWSGATRRSSLSTGAGSLMRSSLKRKPHLPLNPMRRPPMS